MAHVWIIEADLLEDKDDPWFPCEGGTHYLTRDYARTQKYIVQQKAISDYKIRDIPLHEYRVRKYVRVEDSR